MPSVKSQILFIIKNISQAIAFDSLVGNKYEHPWPQMTEIADLDFAKTYKPNDNGTETTRIFKYTAISNAPIYWPGEVMLQVLGCDITQSFCTIVSVLYWFFLSIHLWC